MKTASSILVFCVLALLSLGMVVLYSAEMSMGGSRYFAMQLVWAVIGLVICFVVALVPPEGWQRWSWLLLGVAVLLLSIVLIPGVGLRINGARRWIPLGIANFQPSELAKIALVIALAAYADRYQRHMTTFGRGIVIPGAICGIVLGLIFMEPDRGTTILLAAVAGSLLLIAGVRWLFIVPLSLGGSAVLAYSLMTDTIRSARIQSWLNLDQSKEGAGYQVYQSLTAFGSGGMQGVGLGNSRYKLANLLPEHQTDFIFAVIGEELGLIATLSVVAAFVAIVISGFVIAARSATLFRLLLGFGITLLIGLQALINIAVVTGVLPNKGLPLPFISYGGSNLLMMLACVGLLLGLTYHEEEPESGGKNPFRRRRRTSLEMR